MSSLEGYPGLDPIIEHFGGLPQQPKKDIAEYVAGQGLPIPEIFDDLDAALASDQPFIARSENPYEMYYSGLTCSMRSTEYGEEIKRVDKVLGSPERSFNSITASDVILRRCFIDAEVWRCQALGDGFGQEAGNEFANHHSLSYWKLQDGDNLFMIEDSGKKGRYFVGKINHKVGLVTIEDGQLAEQLSWAMTPYYPVVDAEKLVEYYEKVRSLPLFDANNCPLIEVADPGEDKEPLFLQYFPTNEQQDESFEVGRPSDKVFFVRGATPENGVEFKLWTKPFDRYDKPTSEAFGSGSIFRSDSVAEYYLPQASVYIQPGQFYDRHERVRLLVATVDHGTRSLVFKPRVTIGLSEGAYYKLMDAGGRGGYTECLVVSNGEQAEIQYYDKNSKTTETL